MCTSREVVAAGFLVFRRLHQNIEYLLLQSAFQHHWTPPKGHVDLGESEIETAWRETHEEAGYTSEDLDVIEGFQKALRYEVHNKSKRVEYWIAELKDPEKEVTLSEESQDFKWLPIDSALETAGFSDMRELLKSADEFIRHLGNNPVTTV